VLSKRDREGSIVDVSLVLGAVVGLVDADSHVSQPHLARDDRNVEQLLLLLPLFGALALCDRREVAQGVYGQPPGLLKDRGVGPRILNPTIGGRRDKEPVRSRLRVIQTALRAEEGQAGLRRAVFEKTTLVVPAGGGVEGAAALVDEAPELAGPTAVYAQGAFVVIAAHGAGVAGLCEGLEGGKGVFVGHEDGVVD